MNDGAARFTGSHITYVDYDKAAFKAALDAGSSVAPTVKEAGELFDTYEQPRPFTGTQHTHTHTHTHDTSDTRGSSLRIRTSEPFVSYSGRRWWIFP